MPEKPTYEELKLRIQELEHELAQTKSERGRSRDLLHESSALFHILFENASF